MNVLGFFKDAAGPLTGLTPTCTIRTVPVGSVVASGTMTEVGGGFYNYVFSGRAVATDYAVLCDGGAGLDANDRYAVGEIPADAGEYTTTLSSISSGVSDVYAAVTNYAAYQADVSEIPTSAEVDVKLAAVIESVVGNASSETLKSLRTVLDVVAAAVGVILAIEKGDWELDADMKQLIYTDADTGLEIVRFNMQDIDGTPSIESMFKRLRA